VPTDDEWKELEMFLGMSQAQANSTGTMRGTDEGGKLKEVGTVHWNSPNYGATNFSGFTALPGGYRGFNNPANFYNMIIYGKFWSATEENSTYAWYRGLIYINSRVIRYGEDKQSGFSLRCVRD